MKMWNVRQAFDALVRRRAGLVLVALVVGILGATLWPFHRPRNSVSWLPQGQGIRLKDHAMLQDPGPALASAAAVEMWLVPGVTDDSRTILSFSAPTGMNDVLIRQYRSNLQVRWQSNEEDAWRPRVHEIDSEDIFAAGEPVWVAVTFGAGEVEVYADGKPIDVTWNSGALPISTAHGHLLVSSAPLGSDSWVGEIRGAAIYGRKLGPAEIARHYRSWVETGRPKLEPSDQCDRLYLFSEGQGAIVRNYAREGGDLIIPEQYTVIRKPLLYPIWRERVWELWYSQDVFFNILGFLPLGFMIYSKLAALRPRFSAVWIAIIWSALLSLTIECAQHWLPTRESTMTDIVANTLGSMLGGIVAHQHFVRKKSHATPAQLGAQETATSRNS